MKKLIIVAVALIALIALAGCSIEICQRINSNYSERSYVDDSSKIEKAVNDMLADIKTKDMVLTRICVYEVLSRGKFVVEVDACARAEILKLN